MYLFLVCKDFFGSKCDYHCYLYIIQEGCYAYVADPPPLNYFNFLLVQIVLYSLIIQAALKKNVYSICLSVLITSVHQTNWLLTKMCN